MGILSDIFVAKPADAAKYEDHMNSETGDKLYEVASYKNLTPLEFGTLWAILEGRPYDDKKHGLLEVKPTEESWLYRFPSEYVQLLANLTPGKIEAASVPWAATEEISGEASDMAEVIVEVSKLARHALLPGKGLFLWNCL